MNIGKAQLLTIFASEMPDNSKLEPLDVGMVLTYEYMAANYPDTLARVAQQIANVSKYLFAIQE